LSGASWVSVCVASNTKTAPSAATVQANNPSIFSRAPVGVAATCVAVGLGADARGGESDTVAMDVAVGSTATCVAVGLVADARGGESDTVAMDVAVGSAGTGVAVGAGPHAARNNRLKNTITLVLERTILVNFHLHATSGPMP